MPSEPVSIQLQRALEYIIGRDAIDEMKARFQTHFVDHLTEEQRDAVISFNVLPEVFVEWYRQGSPDYPKGLSRASVHIASLCDEHDPCTFQPFRPWIVVFLHEEKPFPGYYRRWDVFAGMPLYFKEM